MNRAALLIQQQFASHELLTLPGGNPWQWWAPQTIADITQCPPLVVVEVWPLVYAELEKRGIADYDTCRAAIATIAIETAHTFLPVREAFWLDRDYGYEWAEQWRRDNLRYYPHYGRGLIQITWEYNYSYYGWLIGHPEIHDFPDKALLMNVSTAIFAAYFLDKGVNIAAAKEDWHQVRRLVQGGSAGLQELISIVGELDAVARDKTISLKQVLNSGYARVGDPYVWDGDQPGGFDCSGYVSWCYKGIVDSYTDTIYWQTQEISYPAPGDIVLYEYIDPNQPNTRFPHVGLWLNMRETIDARNRYGVGVHPHVVGATRYVRRVPGVVVDTLRQ